MFFPLVVVITAVLLAFSVPADAKGIGGYAGNDSLIHIWGHGTIHGGLVFETVTDGSAYTSLQALADDRTWPGPNLTQEITISIPEGATVKLARLYNYYCWSTSNYADGSKPGMPAEADMWFTNATTTEKKICKHGLEDGLDNRNSLANPIDYENGVIQYWDTKGQNYESKTYDYPSGVFAWDVTDMVTGSGTYTAKIQNNDSTPTDGRIPVPPYAQWERFIPFGFGLLVVYEDSNSPEIEYWIAEGCDYLKLGFGETPENATVNATLDSVSKTGNATLTTVWTHTDGGNLTDWDASKNMMSFNGEEIGPSTAVSNTAIGLNYFDVTAVSGENVVKFQDRGDDSCVHNAFLVIPAQRAFRSTTGNGTYETALPGIDGKIKVSHTGNIGVFLSKYGSNPHPESAFPVNSLSKWIDLEVSNKSNVSWPIRVEMNYTAAEVSAAGIDEATLAIYYWNGDSWEKCSSTGVYTGNKTIWADIAEGELGGSPLNAGGETSGSAPVAVPEYNTVGLIALIAVLSVVLAAATAGSRRRKK